MKRAVFLAGVCAFFCCVYLASCGKYEEGPLISLTSPQKRMYETRILESYTVDGVDSMDMFYDSLGLRFEFFYDYVNSQDICRITGQRKDGVDGILSWRWTLKDNDEILYVTNAGATLTGIPPINLNMEWEILRLTRKDLKIRTRYNEKEYIISLGPFN